MSRIDFVGKHLSFLDLFTVYTVVEIPMIQRDYAHGRASAKDVRDQFLSDICHTLENNMSMSLDFIYGTVKEEPTVEPTDKTKGPSLTFMPIDGQQRLTTLFLLHWYLAFCSGQSEQFNMIFKIDGREGNQFRYMVRPSSHRFFSKLLGYTPGDLKESIKEQIQNESWFFENWLHDPTVLGALVMLDAIQKKFSNKGNLSEFYNRLSSCITMEVLDLGDEVSADDIYLKMNGRGRDLTGFEKFKAWLIKNNKSLDWSVPDNDTKKQNRSWRLLLDVEWLELFWHFHIDIETPALPVSKAYFRMFVALAVNYHAAQKKDSKTEPYWFLDEATYKETIWERLFNDTDCLKSIFAILQELSMRSEVGWPIEILHERQVTNKVGPFNNVKLDKVFFETPSESLGFDARVWLHSIVVFFRCNIPQGGQEEVHWFRVIRNLIANVEIDASNFINVIKSIDKLADITKVTNGSLLIALANLPNSESWLPTQFGKQLNEEIQKAKLMLLPEIGIQWKDAIIEAENHPVLYGQIELLLPPDNSFETFKSRCDVFYKLLDDNGDKNDPNKDEYLLARATLVQRQFDPIQLNSQDRIYFPTSVSDWRSLLNRYRGKRFIRDGMKMLITHFRGKVDLKFELNEVINSADNQEHWMSDIIRYGGELFVHSDTKKIQKYYENGVFLYQRTNASEGDILLGPIAALRNHLIQHLIGENWIYSNGDENWRRVVVCADPERIYFKGHQIRLSKKINSSDFIFCLFNYKSLTIGVSDKTPSVTIDYSDINLKKLSETESHDIKAVIEDLIKFCEKPADGEQKPITLAHCETEGVASHE